MDTTYLVITTAAMLFISAISTGSIIKMKFGKKANVNNLNLNTLSAESLLEVIAGAALSDLLDEGDNVEIVIKTNGQPIAGKEYLVTNLNGHIKLVTESEAQLSGQTA